ncbi:hypothetical protein V5O48_016305, partial [Marasmius crinis-equi]
LQPLTITLHHSPSDNKVPFELDLIRPGESVSEFLTVANGRFTSTEVSLEVAATGWIWAVAGRGGPGITTLFSAAQTVLALDPAQAPTSQPTGESTTNSNRDSASNTAPSLSLPATPVTSAPPAASTPSSTSSTEPSSLASPTSRAKAKAIIGGAVGGTLGLLLVGILIILLHRRSSRPFRAISFGHLCCRRHQSFGITALPLPDWPLFIPIKIHEKPPRAVGQNPPTEASLPPVGMRERKERIPENRTGTEAVETPQSDEQTYPNSTETGREQPIEQTQGPEILAQLSIVVQRLAHIEARLGEEPPPDYSSNRS